MIWRCGPLLKKQVFLPEIRESRKERNTASPGRESGSSFQNDKIGKGGCGLPFFYIQKGSSGKRTLDQLLEERPDD
jgi:hypothetical protein